MMNDADTGKREWIQSALGEHEGPLLRYAQRITGDLEQARDVVQDTFLKLWREDPAELDGHLAEWLFTVCRNKAIDVRRKESRMTTVAEAQLSTRAGDEFTPDVVAERRDTAGRALELLERLPGNQQEVIRLKFQNGLSYREISGVTGLTVTNVGFLIHRGIKTLREQMCRLEPQT
jgi:RNA polymerase sigma-70 factor (ECF subfamily)